MGLVVEVLVLRSFTAPSYLAYGIFVALAALPLWLGVRRGRRTRALFLAKRLFRRLSETDRATVLAMMDEAQVPHRLAAPMPG